MKKHQRILADINKLRIKHGRYRARELPSLACSRPNLAPCSNTVVYTASTSTNAAKHKDAKQYAIGHLHKSSMQLITPGDVALGNLNALGGQKR